MPPETPAAAPPPPPDDAGGWAVVAERERSAPSARGVVPPVVPPEAWTPPEPTAEPHAAPPPARRAAPTDGSPEPALADDLDALIESLEEAPRIVPDPDFDGPSPDRADDVDDLASETLAKIYAAQHQYVEAAVMYERLAARTPERAADLLARAAELRDSASG